MVAENSALNPGIGIVGAGRMGRGIALSYIFAGVPVLLLDLKQRSDDERHALHASVTEELTQDLRFMSNMNLLDESDVDDVVARVKFAASDDSHNVIQHCEIVYEAVPELVEAKKDAFDYLSQHAANEAILASTTSTILVSDLARMVVNPKRYLNAHWLNPAHLMPLVELSKSEQSSQACIDRLKESLESIGKVPVVCSPSPGYIVPRIQALAMSEAARLVEEGVASAEDVDKAVRLGFGLRFSVLGLLEFIDWGGGDILFHASSHLSKSLGSRFEAPDIVAKNMRENHNGLRDGKGFFDYEDVDTHHYREQRMRDFMQVLEQRDLLPILNRAAK